MLVVTSKAVPRSLPVDAGVVKIAGLMLLIDGDIAQDGGAIGDGEGGVGDAVGVAAPGGGDAIGAGREAGEGISGDIRAVAAGGVGVIAAVVAGLVGRAPVADLGEAGVAIIDDLDGGGGGDGASDVKGEGGEIGIVAGEGDGAAVDADAGRAIEACRTNVVDAPGASVVLPKPETRENPAGSAPMAPRWRSAVPRLFTVKVLLTGEPGGVVPKLERRRCRWPDRWNRRGPGPWGPVTRLPTRSMRMASASM